METICCGHMLTYADVCGRMLTYADVCCGNLKCTGSSGSAFLVLQRHLHTSAYVSIRQHTSAYDSIRQHASTCVSIRQHMSRQHPSAYISIRPHTSAYVSYQYIRIYLSLSLQWKCFPCSAASAYVSIRQHTSAYVSIRQHTSAYDK